MVSAGSKASKRATKASKPHSEPKHESMLKSKKSISDELKSTLSSKTKLSPPKSRTEPSKTKFISNALNNPIKKPSVPSATKKSKPRPSDTRQSSTKKAKPSTLAPPSDSEDSAGEEDEDEDVVAGRGSEEESEDDTADDEGSQYEDGEEDAHLHGFSSSDDDSSDEGDDMDEEEVGIDVGKLPTIAKDDATVRSKLEKALKQTAQDRGVVYIGRLPHGFFEDQLKAYFSQFGNVTRLRVSRNKKTGHSKHRAFLEFDSSSVAQIVAETMDNYLLMGHLLTCKVIPKDKVHPELWVGANRKWRKVPTSRVAREAHNKPRTEEEVERATKRLLKRQSEKKRKLAAIGISYNMDKVTYKKAKATKT